MDGMDWGDPTSRSSMLEHLAAGVDPHTDYVSDQGPAGVDNWLRTFANLRAEMPYVSDRGHVQGVADHRVRWLENSGRPLPVVVEREYDGPSIGLPRFSVSFEIHRDRDVMCGAAASDQRLAAELTSVVADARAQLRLRLYDAARLLLDPWGWHELLHPTQEIVSYAQPPFRVEVFRWDMGSYREFESDGQWTFWGSYDFAMGAFLAPVSVPARGVPGAHLRSAGV